MKKRIMSVLTAVLMLLSLFTFTVSASNIYVTVASGMCGENLTWSYSNGTLEIKGYGPMNNYDHKTAPWNKFAWQIQSIVFENGITTIGNFAFADTAIRSIVIPEGVTHIGEWAFLECNTLSEVSFPDSLIDIGRVAFSHTALKSIDIPNSIKCINESVFSFCGSVTELNIPDNVQIISDDAFYNLHNLQKVYLSDNITSIGKGAFDTLSTDMDNPSKQRILDVYTPEGSEAYKWAESKGYNVFASTREEYNAKFNIETSSSSLDIFSGVSDWAKPEIEEAVEKKLIPDVLVSTDLKETINRKEFAALAVTLYEAVTKEEAEYDNCPFNDIDESDIAIKKAYSLGITTGATEKTFEPLTLISREQLATMLCRVFKKYAFSGWSVETDSNYFLDFFLNYNDVEKFADDDKISEYAIQSVYFMAQNKIINGVGDNRFAPKTDTADGFATREQAVIMALRCYNNLFNVKVTEACGENCLTHDIDGSTLTISGDGYMYDFYATVNAIVGEKNRPWNGDGIKKVVIEKGVKNIGAYAFYEFEELSEIVIKSDIESIGDYAFSNCTNLKNITLPESVKIIGQSSFAGCSGLSEIIIPDSVVSIQDTAFYRCSGLKKAVFGKELKEIGERAFVYCSGLTSITLHDKIDVICEGAFSDCDLLTDVTYVGNESNTKMLFEENRKTEDLVFTRTEGSHGENATWKLENDTLIISGQGKLTWDKINAAILRNINAKNLVIESGITELCESYFWSNHSFEKVVLPNTLHKLGIYTFRGCKNIKEVVFPDTAFTIDGGCFEGCINLTHIYLPEKAKLVGSMPFGEIAYGNPDKIDITFYTSENSSAYNWAKDNGFNVVISTRDEFEQR